MTAFIWIFLGGGVYRSAVLGLQCWGLQECSAGATVGGVYKSVVLGLRLGGGGQVHEDLC